MWYKYVYSTINNLWWNTGFTTYGEKPIDNQYVCWCRPWEVPFN